MINKDKRKKNTCICYKLCSFVYKGILTRKGCPYTFGIILYLSCFLPLRGSYLMFHVSFLWCCETCLNGWLHFLKYAQSWESKWGGGGGAEAGGTKAVLRVGIKWEQMQRKMLPRSSERNGRIPGQGGNSRVNTVGSHCTAVSSYPTHRAAILQSVNGEREGRGEERGGGYRTVVTSPSGESRRRDALLQ